MQDRRTVLSIVSNPATTDARVFKQARALRDAGYRVVLLGRWAKGFAQSETVEGIEVRRMPLFDAAGVRSETIEIIAALAPNAGLRLRTHSNALVERQKRQAPIEAEREAATERIQSINAKLAELKREEAALRNALVAISPTSPTYATPRLNVGSDTAAPQPRSSSEATRAVERTAEAGEPITTLAEAERRVGLPHMGVTTVGAARVLSPKNPLSDLVMGAVRSALPRIAESIRDPKRPLRTRTALATAHVIAGGLAALDRLLRVPLSNPIAISIIWARNTTMSLGEWKLRGLAGLRQTASQRRRWRALRHSMDRLLRERMALRAGLLGHSAKLLAKRHNPNFAEDFYYARYGIMGAHLATLEFDFTPDVIHCHDLYPLPGGAVLAKRTGAKLIYDAHEYETERVPPLPDERKAFVEALENDLFRHTDRIVTVCQSLADLYSKRFDGPRPAVIMNAPEQEPEGAVARHGPDIRAMADVDGAKPLVVYTGGVGQEPRGLDHVVAALAMMEKAHLVVLGPRHPINDAWLMNHVHKAGVAQRVHLLPGVAADQVVNAIATADVAVCPIQDASLSYRFSMPNKLFEAAFARLPIAVSNLPEMRCFVEELGAGKAMDQTDPRSIAETLALLAAQRDRYTMNEEAEALLAAKYAWPVQAKRLAELYAELTTTTREH